MVTLCPHCRFANPDLQHAVDGLWQEPLEKRSALPSNLLQLVLIGFFLNNQTCFLVPTSWYELYAIRNTKPLTHLTVFFPTSLSAPSSAFSHSYPKAGSMICSLFPEGANHSVLGTFAQAAPQAHLLLLLFLFVDRLSFHSRLQVSLHPRGTHKWLIFDFCHWVTSLSSQPMLHGYC